MVKRRYIEIFYLNLFYGKKDNLLMIKANFNVRINRFMIITLGLQLDGSYRDCYIKVVELIKFTKLKC